MSEEIRHQLAIGARRAMFLPAQVNREEAWHILLTLAQCHAERRAISISGASCAAFVPETTGRRHVGLLVAEGLAERRPDPEDGRRHWIEITEAGLSTVHRVLAVPEPVRAAPAYRCSTNTGGDRRWA